MLNKIFKQLKQANDMADFCETTNDVEMCNFYKGKAYALYNVLQMYGLTDFEIAMKLIEADK